MVKSEFKKLVLYLGPDLTIYGYRGDRNLALYLPRLAFLVSIEADRPGAWFPGPLGLYAACFLGIDLCRDFERVKVPGNTMKSPFSFWCLLGVKILAITICARRQPNHVEHLLSGLNNLL
jgi:hypothetical protein